MISSDDSGDVYKLSSLICGSMYTAFKRFSWEWRSGVPRSLISLAAWGTVCREFADIWCHLVYSERMVQFQRGRCVVQTQTCVHPAWFNMTFPKTFTCTFLILGPEARRRLESIEDGPCTPDAAHLARITWAFSSCPHMTTALPTFTTCIFQSRRVGLE